MSTKLWVNDIKILIEQNQLLEFIPTKKMDFNQKINAIVRFSIYLSIILCVLKQSINWSQKFQKKQIFNIEYLNILGIGIIIKTCYQTSKLRKLKEINNENCINTNW